MRRPQKFVGLHAHSGFSTFDGLDYPQEHIDFVLENGMDCWALTDHGHMNGFAHAYLYAEKLKKKGVNFKLIPGCEMYVHPDLTQWQIEYDLRKARKRGDDIAVAQLEKLKAEIENPIEGTANDAEDIVEGTKEDTGLTVEDESESKSNKFFDPIKRRHHLVVLPRTSVGLQRLFHLVSRGYKEGFYRFPRVDYGMLKEAAEGGHIMISSACLGGPLSYEVFKRFVGVEFEELKPCLLDDPVILNDVLSGIRQAYNRLSDAIGHEGVMLELQFNKLAAQHLVNRALIEFARVEGITDKLVVTCDSHMSRPSHWKERELYKKLGWMKNKEFDPDSLPKTIDDLDCQLYPKNADQVWDSYLDTTKEYSFYDDDEVCDAVERTYFIAHEMIGDIVADTSMKLPSYVIPEGETADGALLAACKAGLVERGLHKDPEYIDRVKSELRIIRGKNFSEYFITMKAIIDLAKEHMFVGPGRGSGAGSLVNYVLGITDVDPLKYDLLFERFLSPERTEMPDIDTDIGDRDKLLEILRNKFGEENIVPISNYNTFKLKSLIKDVSKFYGIPFAECNSALAPLEKDCKAGLRKDGIDVIGPVQPTFEMLMKYSPKARKYIEDHPEIAEPLGVLFKQNKALGRHAGGVIVSENIAERMPLIMARGEMQTPWVEGATYKHLEHFGWVKFDLLGLETLRMVERTIEIILKKEGVENPTFSQIYEWFNNNMSPDVIDFDDQSVYENVYHQGKWAGIFQCTQHGSQKLFKTAQPRSIVDIATLTAIYRPGPLGANVHKIYIKNKQNPEQIDYKHPLIKEVLEETYGCIIFQEQVMQLCNQVAGIPKAECNKIRKMMKPVLGGSKDLLDNARALRKRFVEGAVKNGVASHTAESLYDDIMKFASYGFNKSHAVCYAIDSFYCAYLMTYFEEEWLCSYLESMSDKPEKRSKASGEIRALGYSIVPIDINLATKEWRPLPGKKFMPSFLSCKGIGDAAIDEIITNRPFTSMEHLLWNEDGTWKHSKFNKRAMESLIKIKAFDSMGIVGHLGSTFESYRQMEEILIPNWMKLKKSLKKNPWAGRDCFNELLVETAGTEEYSKKEFIQNQVSLLGSVEVSSIIQEELINEIEAAGTPPLEKWTSRFPLVWFIVSQIQIRKTKRGSNYLRMQVMGPSGKQEWMNVWGWNGRTVIEPYSVCTAEIKKDDWGMSASMRGGKFEIF